MLISISMLFGYFLDLIFGDPQGFPHPIYWIGKLISKSEIMLRKSFSQNPDQLRAGGVFLVLIVTVISTMLPIILLIIAYLFHPWLFVCLQIFMFYQLLAVKSLKKESMKVFNELKKNDLERSRYMLSMIVGRDTEQLTEEQIIKATVETIAESTSDGVVAPMFYMMLGGAPLVYFYKSVNTMDSMVGYKNDRYIDFGRAAAKLDDIVNYIPSRIAAFSMLIASFLVAFDHKNAWKIYKRDRRNHASPNSAQTESVCAGALNIMLAGNATYFGKIYEKPTIGDRNRNVEIEDIVRANRLMVATSAVSITILIVIRVIISLLIG